MQLLFLILGIAIMIVGATIYLTNYKHNKTKARVGLLIECFGMTLAFGKWLLFGLWVRF
jgi:hypothetical protein